MQYVALFRGINAGKERRVDMKMLKALLESLELTNVSTYINSGNAIFEATGKKQDVQELIVVRLKHEFGFDIPTLVKTKHEMQKIAEAIPANWNNDSAERSDVAYLFPEIDSRRTINDLPVNKEVMDIRYVKGAIYWRVDRGNYNKSRLNRIIGHKLYQSMTVRNINTARYLSKI